MRRRKKLREAFQNVTWTSIYFEGTKLYIEVKENEKSEPVQIETKGTGISSQMKRGQSRRLSPETVPRVKAGDTVEQGQVLVSGGVPSMMRARPSLTTRFTMRTQIFLSGHPLSTIVRLTAAIL